MALTFAVEVYEPGLTADREPLTAVFARAVAAATQDGDPLVYLGCVALPGDEMSFHLFESDSAETLREVLGAFGVVPERIVPADFGFGERP